MKRDVAGAGWREALLEGRCPIMDRRICAKRRTNKAGPLKAATQHLVNVHGVSQREARVRAGLPTGRSASLVREWASTPADRRVHRTRGLTATSEQQSERSRKRWASATPEERAQVGSHLVASGAAERGRRARWRNATPEERQEHAAMMRAAQTRTQSERMREWWADATPEQKAARQPPRDGRGGRATGANRKLARARLAAIEAIDAIEAAARADIRDLTREERSERRRLERFLEETAR